MRKIKTGSCQFHQLDYPIRELIRRGFQLPHMRHIVGLPCSNRGLLKPQIEVSFTLTSWNCVYAELYEAYKVDDFTSAARKVFNSLSRLIFPRYRVFLPRLGQKCEYFLDSPLPSRSRQLAITRCEEMQGPEPWKWRPDNTLLELYADAVHNGACTSVPRLRVGGLTPDSALENWGFFAAPLLRLFREWSAERRETLRAEKARRAATSTVKSPPDTSQESSPVLLRPPGQY